MTTRHEQAAAFLAALEADRRSAGASTPLRLAAAQLTHVSRDPQVGDVWLVSPPERNEPSCLVALTWIGEERLRGVLASDETWLASTDDLIAEGSASPTGEPLVLSTWRDVPFDRTLLRDWIGALGPDVRDGLLMVLQDRLTGGFRMRAQENRMLADGTIVVGWSIGPIGQPHETRRFLTGSRILEKSDPRLKVRSALAEHTRFLETSATAEERVEGRSPWEDWADAALDHLRQLAGVLLPADDGEPGGLFAPAAALAVRGEDGMRPGVVSFSCETSFGLARVNLTLETGCTIHVRLEEASRAVVDVPVRLAARAARPRTLATGKTDRTGTFRGTFAAPNQRSLRLTIGGGRRATSYDF